MQNRYSDYLESSLYCINDVFTTEDFQVISKGNVPDDIIEKFDLFVFHGVYYYKYISLANKIKSKGKRYFVKPHSSLMIDAQKKAIAKKAIANFLFFKRFINNADAIVFTNYDEAKNSVQWNPNIVYEGNGIQSVQADDIKVRLKKRPYNLVYLSRIDFSHKGTDILLDALYLLKKDKKISDINLSFYGKGSAKEESILIKKIKDLNFPSVSFEGPLYGQEKYDMFNKKDIFILTSRYEGFPMAVLEALDSGLPCLVTKGVNMTSIIQGSNIGWECDTNPSDVANLILTVLETDEEKINRMSESARKYVLDRHNWPSQVKSSEVIYSSVDKRLM
ncbi:Mannosylfructose-phosphate synthase [Aeromonas jandaei]|nr:Mannosylfructose-phosphate synthase [Aeromonas jandaei]